MAYLMDFADLSPSKKVSAIIELFLEKNPTFAMIPFSNNPQMRVEWFTEKSLPTTAFRGTGDSYTASKSTQNKNFLTLMKWGGTTNLDHKEARIMGVDLRNARAREVAMLMKSVRLDSVYNLIHASNDANPKAFDGIYALIDKMDPITAGGTDEGTINLKYTGATNANGVALGVDASVIVGEIDRLIDACISTPTFMYVPRWIQRQLRAVALDTAANNALAGLFVNMPFNYSVNGRSYTAYGLMYDNRVPMFDPGINSSGTNIMDFTEDWGSGTGVCASMVAVVAGENDFLFYQDQPPEILEYESADKLTIGDTIDWALAPAPQSLTSVVRMRGIKKA